jgi:hypothetical protein
LTYPGIGHSNPKLDSNFAPSVEIFEKVEAGKSTGATKNTKTIIAEK